MKRDSLARPKLLLVEGQDEVHFFRQFLAHIGVDGVQVREVGGKDQFPNEFPALLNDPGFSGVRAYAIIRDANGDAQAAFQSVCSLLDNNDQPRPPDPGAFTSDTSPRVGVYVLPGDAAEGMLEDLCLQTVADRPVMSCVDAFMTCLAEHLEKRDEDGPTNPDKSYYPKNEAKARAQAYLAGMYESVPHVGVATQKGYWNLDHSSLDSLRTFLQLLNE